MGHTSSQNIRQIQRIITSFQDKARSPTGPVYDMTRFHASWWAFLQSNQQVFFSWFRTDVWCSQDSHLRRVLTEYLVYYNTRRPHQGLDQDSPLGLTVSTEAPICHRNVLGGIIRDYYREAA